jgi:hypothetical protein
VIAAPSAIPLRMPLEALAKPKAIFDLKVSAHQ